MEFIFGLLVIIVLTIVILLPTKIRKMRRKSEDNLDRFFTEQGDKKDQQLFS